MKRTQRDIGQNEITGSRALGQATPNPASKLDKKVGIERAALKDAPAIPGNVSDRD